MVIVKTIDAHAEGGPLRLIVDGFPAPRGKTMAEKTEWVKRHADHLRSGVLLEPRGHGDMCGAVLTEPVSPGSHAGIIFMDVDGYTPMSGHGIVAVTAIALERGLVVPGGDGRSVVYDTAAGTVRANAHADRRQVSFVNVPSFVTHGGLVVKAAGRHIRVDVAYGGAFYVIVDSEAVGLGLDTDHTAGLRRVGIEIMRSIGSSHEIAHPLLPQARGVFGTVFTSPPRTDSADLRNVTVFGGGQVDRSPGGTSTAAVMSVLDAMGLIAEDRPFVHEGLIDTRFTGRIVDRTMVGEYSAIIAEIGGSAWITGEHTFFIEDDDPLARGFVL
jgi:trans-L-3-hydroxyproline dehydratase